MAAPLVDRLLEGDEELAVLLFATFAFGQKNPRHSKEGMPEGVVVLEAVLQAIGEQVWSSAGEQVLTKIRNDKGSNHTSNTLDTLLREITDRLLADEEEHGPLRDRIDGLARKLAGRYGLDPDMDEPTVKRYSWQK